MKTKMKNQRSVPTCTNDYGNVCPRIPVVGPKPNVNKAKGKTRVGPAVGQMMRSFKRA